MEYDNLERSFVQMLAAFEKDRSPAAKSNWYIHNLPSNDLEVGVA